MESDTKERDPQGVDFFGRCRKPVRAEDAMGLIRKIGGLLDAFARGGADDVSIPVGAGAEPGATEPPEGTGEELPPPAAGGLSRRVAVLADLVTISKDLGRLWPRVRTTVERMEWLPPIGRPSERRLADVADALLDGVVAAADASMERGGDARRLRPILRDVRKVLGLYASYRIDGARHADQTSATALLSKGRFDARIAAEGLDHLGIDWTDAGTIGRSIADAFGRTLPADDIRGRYVPRSDRGRRYLDLPVARQVAREAELGEPRIFQAQVDVVGLLATAVCAGYEPALRRAAAEKMRHWIGENLPSLTTDLRRAHSDWMIDVRPQRMRSWEPILVEQVFLPRMPFAAFEDALASRRIPTDADQAATIVKSALSTFVLEQYDLHREMLDAIRDEYVAESRIEIAVERQMAFAAARIERTEIPVPTP
jgi:hypothetical protein